MTSLGNLVVHHPFKKHHPVLTGFPVPADVDLQQGAEIRFADGVTCVAQAHALTPVTSVGVRWWELSWLSDAEGPAEVVPRQAALPGSDLWQPAGDGGVLDNGKVRIELTPHAKDGAPIRLTWAGGSGTLSPKVDARQLGACREADDAVRQVRCLRRGPVRAQVEILGQLAGSLHGQGGGPAGQLDYRLTVELWADHPAVRVDWMITHRVPGMPDLTVTHATLEGQWELGDQPCRLFRQSHYSAAWRPRDVVNSDPVTLIADTQAGGVRVSDPAMLRDDQTYPFYCNPPLVSTAHWLELRGSAGRVSAQVVDIEATRPNALRSVDRTLSYDMVPAGHELTWSQGWRKQQTLLLSFAGADDAVDGSGLAAKAAMLFSPGRAQPSTDTLRERQCFEIQHMLRGERRPDASLRFNAMLASLCKLMTCGDKFNLGDTPDWHYTRGYANSNHNYLPLPPFDRLPRAMSFDGRVFPDMVKYFVEPVWTNNEYDIIHALAIEVMRTGRHDAFAMLRWAARHNVEIDFLSYSDDQWHHRASPFHSHRHNRKGAITSHFWTQGLLQYYCLTGDRDALEVATALGDKIIEVNADAQVRTWNFDREVGWALLALCALVECGYEAYRDEATKVATFLQAFDRRAFSGAVFLSGGRSGRSLERQMVDAGFGYSPLVEAMGRFEALAGNERTAQWFDTLLRQILDAVWEKAQEGERPLIRHMTGLLMAIGYERTGDKAFLRAGRLMLEIYLDGCVKTPGTVPENAGEEGGEVKPCALAYRGLHRLLGALERAGELDRYEYPALREYRDAMARSGS